MTRKATPNSSIEELEGERWREPDLDSHVVLECHRLRKLQLRLFTVENLRLMLGQDIGSRYLVPIALEHLEADPFVAGDFYPGDLHADDEIPEKAIRKACDRFRADR